MHGLVDIPAFDFDQLRFDWGDVILAAIGWGEWQRIERSVAEGLACAADAQADEVDLERLSAAIVRFRRSRRLLAGEEYLRWLSERNLSAGSVRAHFLRAGLRQRAVDRLPVELKSSAADPVQLAEATRVGVMLDGWLQAWAERLARCVAAAHALSAAGREPPIAPGNTVRALVRAAAVDPAAGIDEAQARARAPRVAAFQASMNTFSAHILTRERLERCLSGHRLDWQRFVWEEVRFRAEGAAREAALLVREDRMELDAVADLGHTSVKVREAYADGVSELSAPLTAAVPGEFVGPLFDDGEWLLARVLARRPPTIDDPVLRDRAHTELIDDALERHLAGRVTWHGKY